MGWFTEFPDGQVPVAWSAISPFQVLLTAGAEPWKKNHFGAVFPVVTLASVFWEAVLFRPAEAMFTTSCQSGHSLQMASSMAHILALPAHANGNQYLWQSPSLGCLCF